MLPVHHWSPFIPPLNGAQSLSVRKKIRSGNHVCDVAAGFVYLIENIHRVANETK